MVDRGQTVNDYLLGITIMLLSVIIVFGFFPEIFTPFDQQVTSEEGAMADNLASKLVTNSTTGGSQQQIDFVTLQVLLTELENTPELAGVPENRTNWNVTVLNNEGESVTLKSSARDFGGEIVNGGTTWDNDLAESRVRYVEAQDTNQVLNCQNGCRIIVRVW
jgi:hypothetical protein